MVAGGALLLLSVVPQLPPLSSVWSISTSGYLLAPGVLLGLALIWTGAADSLFWFVGVSSGAIDVLRSIAVAALAVVGSIVLRPLRQGLSAAVAFIGLAGLLSVLPGVLGGWDFEIIHPIQGLIVLGLCAALVFLPDAVGGQAPIAATATTPPAASAVKARNEVAPTELPADSPRPESGGSETVAASAQNTDVSNPEVPESPDDNDAGPTTIDAPPPTGPRRD